MAVISTAEYKAYSGITAATWDTLIGTLIANAQAQAERYCARSFDTATFTEMHNGGGTGFLLLKNAPITSITSVKHVATDGTKTTIESTRYKFDAATGELYLVPRGLAKTTSYDGLGVPFSNWTRGSGFVEGFQNYEVIYVGGYATAPSDLKQALFEMVDEMFRPIQMGTGDSKQYQSESLGDYSYSRAAVGDYRSIWQARLQPFKRYYV
jgi:hypothetical protein